MTRLVLFIMLVFVLLLIASFFRQLGWGEIALIAAVLALASLVEAGRYWVKKFLSGYRR